LDRLKVLAGLIVFFSPELLVLGAIGLGVFVYLVLHIRSFIRNAFRMAALLFGWAVQAGFVGFVACIAAWIFMFPVMATLCGLAGTARTWTEARVARQAKKQTKPCT
jgi:hypothetical protein